MNLTEIKNLNYLQIMDQLYDQALDFGIDIRSRRRTADYVMAKKGFIHIARNERSIGLQKIGDFLGVGHDTVLHHARTAKAWIETEDKEFIEIINKIYSIDYYSKWAEDPLKQKLAEYNKLDHILPFVEVLKDIPEDKVGIMLEKIKLFKQSFNWKNYG